MVITAMPSISENLNEISCENSAPDYTTAARTVSPDTRGHLRSVREL
jgi:hypothetical protein